MCRGLPAFCGRLFQTPKPDGDSDGVCLNLYTGPGLMTNAAFILLPVYSSQRSRGAEGSGSSGDAGAGWGEAFGSLFGSNSQTAAYYLMEFGAILLGLAACIATWRRYPGLSAYGLAAILLSLTSGPAQGMHRYVLAVPSVFLFLSRLGRSEAFDRAWSMLSILLMGLLATLFTFDMWVG